MFFDLSNFKDSTHLTRSLDFYIENGKHTLALKFPMVVFCDSSTHLLLQEIRDREVGPDVPTEYIVKNIAEYDYYKLHFENVENNRKTTNGYTCADKRNTVSYFLTTTFKNIALYISKQRNFFNTTHYAWIDVGCNHVVRSLSEFAPLMLIKPKPKISLCYIHYRGDSELYPISNYLSNGGPCAIATTAYTIEADYVDKLYNVAMSVFHEQLSEGYGHADEQVMIYCYHKKPEWFNLYYGDYYSIVTNYNQAKQDVYTIYYCFIQSALRYRRYDLASDAAKTILIANSADEAFKNILLEIVKNN